MTEASSSTSSASIVTGSLSTATTLDNSPADSGFRVVAIAVCPARARVMAVDIPIPLLVPEAPVIIAIAIGVLPRGLFSVRPEAVSQSRSDGDATRNGRQGWSKITRHRRAPRFLRDGVDL